ncbi:MAG TPA: hypothetical protein VGG74_31210 [Kofleriaceae bacterium]|jgi:hypothetical protein
MWSRATRVLFRWWFVFSTLEVLELICFPLRSVWSPLRFLDWPFMRTASWLTTLWSEHVFGYTPSGELYGSDQDTAWLVMITFAAVAWLVALVWTWRAKATSYDRLLDLHRTFVRYGLATVMLYYAYAKILPLQFWAPTPSDLEQTYGNSSPFALAWRFIGYSRPYQVFGGLAEATGAVLLLSRRTTTLGALVLVSVLANVVMLNFCYAIPVKRFSSLLLLFSLYLTIPDLRRLWRVLVLHRAVEPRPLRPYPFTGRMELARRSAKVAVIAILGWLGYRDFARGGYPIPSVAGVYDAEGTGSWRTAVLGGAFGGGQLLGVEPNGVRHTYGFTVDADKHELVLNGDDGKDQPTSWRELGPGEFELSGMLDGARIDLRLHRRPATVAPLLAREFTWFDPGGYWN